MNLETLCNKIVKDYTMPLLKWAYQRTGNHTEAEDVVQDVMLQLFQSIKRLNEKGEKIDNLKGYIWKVAHYVWCNHLRDNKFHLICEPMADVGNASIHSDDVAAELASVHQDNEKKETLLKMRLSVSRLNYMHREAIIMHYIDSLPIKEIASRLKITENNVKKVLFDARKKVREAVVKMENNDNYVYRPKRLLVTFTGQINENNDITFITKSLSKQNICIECYETPKTLDDLTETLGIPKAYLEDDLDWLVEREFLKLHKGRYSTMFFIYTAEFETEKMRVFMKHKATFSDKIIKRLIDQQEKIKSIGFYGSEYPIEKLLWLLIYMLIKDIILRDYTMVFEDYPIRPDGYRYIPRGFMQSQNPENIKQVLSEKYTSILGWQTTGYMTCEFAPPVKNVNNLSHLEYHDKDYGLVEGGKGGELISYFKALWYGMYNAGNSKIATMFSLNKETYRMVIGKVLRPDFEKENLNDDEKALLGEMISWGMFSILGTQASCLHHNINAITPNFYIFTEKQFQALETILSNIREELTLESQQICDELALMCQKSLPKQLKHQHKYIVRNAFNTIAYTTTAFGFYDDKLYIPKDEQECALLTLLMMVKE